MSGEDVTKLRHWQVKDFPEDKRQAVIRAAAGAGKTVAEWLEPVIDTALAHGLPVPVNLMNGRTSERQQQLAEARELAAIVAELARAGADKSIRHDANRPLRETLQLLRPARALPTLLPRPDRAAE